MKVKVKVTLVIDDLIFHVCLFPLYFYSYIYFIMLTNPLTTHKLKPLADPVLFCTTNLSFYSVHCP
jgi:hypothetical protein